MKSISGESPARCMARMRSAAKTKLPLSTGTTRRRCGRFSAMALAIASMRSEIWASENNTAMRCPSISMCDMPGIYADFIRTGKANLHILGGGRRRSDAGGKGRHFAGAQRPYAGIDRPGIDVIGSAIFQDEAERGNFAVLIAHIDDLPLDRNDAGSIDDDMLLLDAADLEAIDIHIYAGIVEEGHAGGHQADGGFRHEEAGEEGREKGSGKAGPAIKPPSPLVLPEDEFLACNARRLGQAANFALFAGLRRADRRGQRTRCDIDDLDGAAFDPVMAAFDAANHGAAGA